MVIGFDEHISYPKRSNPFSWSKLSLSGLKCWRDISYGNSFGIKTLLVLAGVTTLKQLEQYKNYEQHLLVPDFYTNSLGDMLDFLEECADTN